MPHPHSTSEPTCSCEKAEENCGSGTSSSQTWRQFLPCKPWPAMGRKEAPTQGFSDSEQRSSGLILQQRAWNLRSHISNEAPLAMWLGLLGPGLLF